MEWLVISFFLIAAILWWANSAYRRPLLELREALAKTAIEEGEKPQDRLSGLPLSSDAFRELQRIEQRVESMRRQISDESFNLQAILSSMVEGVLIVDDSQRIRLANEGLHRLFSLKNSPINRSIMEVFRNHALRDTLRTAIITREPRSQEITIETFRDGTYIPRHFEVTAVSLASRPEVLPYGAIAVFHDITTIKELEAVRRDFVANVSHELRTPLSIINGYIETLIDGGLEDSESALRFLNVMAKHGERLNFLIEDLLTLSRLESDSAGLTLEWVDLAACVNRVLEQLERNLKHKSAETTVNIEEAAAYVHADEQRLEQALFNLIDNACKYGSVNLRLLISARMVDDVVEISVCDNGPGIPLEDQPHIFQRFYRVHKDRSRDAGGTGLGLSIVKHIMQLHKGSASVRSTPGAGATMFLKFPSKIPS